MGGLAKTEIEFFAACIKIMQADFNVALSSSSTSRMLTPFLMS